MNRDGEAMGDSLRQLNLSDNRDMEQLTALLSGEGLTRDANLDYCCGIFDEDERLIATGSCAGCTLRCLAVAAGHRGEGLLNRIVSRLNEVQLARGNSHLFVYTKTSSARFIASLGFYEITRVDGLVFMENRRGGFEHFCARLEKSRRPGKSAAIVMNANPFTLGHRYLAERAAAENDTVHIFVLSEESSPIPYKVRRQLVEEGTADLRNVLCHDTGPYIISSATFPSYFLPDEDSAILSHARLDAAVFGPIAGSLGVSRRYVGQEPASHVTALYNRVLSAALPEMGIDCVILPRLSLDGEIISASTVRQCIHDGDMQSLSHMLPDTSLRYFLSPEAEPVIKAIRAMPSPRHY